MVGEREAALERAVGDAPIDKVGALLVAVLVLAPGDDQHVLLGGDVDLVGLEAGDRELDAIVVVAELDQVERRVVLAGLAHRAVLEHVEQPVEADGGAPERREVECATHSFYPPHVEQGRATRPRTVSTVPSPGPNGAQREKSGSKITDFKRSAGNC